MKYKDSRPQYVQLAEKFSDRIKSGEFIKGAKLPSVRNFAVDEGISHITANKVFVRLSDLGLVERVHGSGSFVIYESPFDIEKQVTEEYVNDQFNQIKSLKQNRSLLVTLLKNTTHICPYNFSYALLNPDYVNKLLPSVSSALSGWECKREYGNMKGSLHLREELINCFSIKGSTENVLITHGNQHGINLIAQLLLKADDYVFIENPTYTGAVDTFSNLNINLINLDIFKLGFDGVEFEQKLIKYRPKLVFLTPNFSNPTGYALSINERKELLKLSKQYNFYIVEDDHWSEFAYDHEIVPFFSLETPIENVIGLRGFSKVIGPDARIGALFASKEIIDEVEKIITLQSLGVSNFSQEYLFQILKNGCYQNVIKRILDDLNQRRIITNKILLPLKKYGVKFDIPDGGINFWIVLPESYNSEALLFESMFKEGITFLPGSLSGVNSLSEYAHCLRLNFSYLSHSSLKVGLKKFVKLLIDELSD